MPCLLEESAAGAGIVEALDRLAQGVLGDRKAEMPRGHLLDRVRFVKDDEVVGEEIAAAILPAVLEQGEEEGVVEHEDGGRLGLPPGLLVEAAGILAARFRRAEMPLGADLCPELWRGFEGKVAQGAVRCGRRPLPQTLQFGFLLGGEEIRRVADGPLEASGAEIVLSSLQQDGLRIAPGDRLGQRDVLVEKLFLEIDRVGADEGLPSRARRMQDGRNKVGKGLPDAGSRLNDQVAAVLKGRRHRACHARLLGPALKSAHGRQGPLRTKDGVDLTLEGTRAPGRGGDVFIE